MPKLTLSDDLTRVKKTQKRHGSAVQHTFMMRVMAAAVAGEQKKPP